MKKETAVLFVMVLAIIGVSIFASCATTKTTNPDGSVTTVTSIDTQAIVALAPVATQLAAEIAQLQEQQQAATTAAQQAAAATRLQNLQAMLATVEALIGKAPAATNTAKLTLAKVTVNTADVKPLAQVAAYLETELQTASPDDKARLETLLANVRAVLGKAN